MLQTLDLFECSHEINEDLESNRKQNFWSKLNNVILKDDFTISRLKFTHSMCGTET